MELRHLRYFVAVAESENVTRAAARLHVSQPGVSRQIRDLEEELGVRLFSRSAQALRLTSAGAMFLSEVRDVLQRVDAAVAAVRSANSHPAETIHIGYAPSLTVHILPAAMRAFRSSHPEVQVMLHDMTGSEMLVGLTEGTLHAAFTEVPDFDGKKGIDYKVLAEYPLGILLPTGHRLSRRKSLKLTELQNENLVIYSRAGYPDYKRLVQKLPGLTASRLRAAYPSDGAVSLIAAVESGQGIAVVAQSMLGMASSRVHFVPLDPGTTPSVMIGIAYRTAKMSPALLEFIQKAEDVSARPRMPA